MKQVKTVVNAARYARPEQQAMFSSANLVKPLAHQAQLQQPRLFSQQCKSLEACRLGFDTESDRILHYTWSGKAVISSSGNNTVRTQVLAGPAFPVCRPCNSEDGTLIPGTDLSSAIPCSATENLRP